jgi:predicted SprT family Zn-dependent metalloprotease
MRKKQAKKVTARSYQRNEPLAITPVEYGGLQEAYDHFNKELFEGALPDVFITYQRKAHSAGYFSAERFSGRTGKFAKHELALNPDGFIGHSDLQICQTLGHEMVHVQQHAFGQPSARGYHNAQWAQMMKVIGLQPSNTGMVGGKETGQHMSDYVIPGTQKSAQQHPAQSGRLAPATALIISSLSSTATARTGG